MDSPAHYQYFNENPEPVCLEDMWPFSGDFAYTLGFVEVTEPVKITQQLRRPFLPIARRQKPSVEFVKLTDDMRSFEAYPKLRMERMSQRHAGARAKNAQKK